MSCYDCAKAQGHELECPRHERNKREEVLTVTVPKGFSVPNVNWTPASEETEDPPDTLKQKRRTVAGQRTGDLEGQLSQCGGGDNDNCDWCQVIREELAERKARAALADGLKPIGKLQPMQSDDQGDLVMAELGPDGWVIANEQAVSPLGKFVGQCAADEGAEKKEEPHKHDFKPVSLDASLPANLRRQQCECGAWTVPGATVEEYGKRLQKKGEAE